MKAPWLSTCFDSPLSKVKTVHGLFAIRREVRGERVEARAPNHLERRIESSGKRGCRSGGASPMLIVISQAQVARTSPKHPWEVSSDLGYGMIRLRPSVRGGHRDLEDHESRGQRHHDLQPSFAFGRVLSRTRHDLRCQGALPKRMAEKFLLRSSASSLRRYVRSGQVRESSTWPWQR